MMLKKRLKKHLERTKISQYYYMERMILLKDLKFLLDTNRKSNFVELSK